MTIHVSPLSHDQRPLPGAPVSGIPGDRGRSPRDSTSLAPWAIVAIWAVLLGILAAVSAAMGNNMVVLEISGGAAVLVLVVAGAVWLDQRLRPHRGVYSQPVRIGGVFLFAVTAVTAWLALAFGQFMLYLAAVPLAGALGLEIAARRHARAETAVAALGARHG